MRRLHSTSRAGNGSRPKKSNEGVPIPCGAYFLSLGLENVRCFGAELQTLDLSAKSGGPAQWTILLGNNGTGKTTVLQSLAMFGLVGTKRTIRLSFEHSLRRSKRYTAWNMSRCGSEHDGRLQVSAMPANGLRTRSGDFPSFQMGLPFRDGVAGAMASPSVEGVFFAPVCFGYGAARRTGTLPLSDGDLEDTTASLFSDSAELRSAEEWLAQLDWAASKTSVVQKRQKSTFEDVRKLLVQILPDVNDIRIAAPTETRPLPRVEFETPFGWTPLRSLGFGYQSLITWMVDFASHMVELYPDSHDPLAEPAVVLVDEIDLHLHATWQRDLMAYLTKRFPNTQFIVTAHSPLIVQAAAEVDANIALLRREGDHVVIDNDIEAVRGWRVDQVLTSDLFGLPSARPPALDGIIKRREEILLKPRVSKADQAELARLEKQIGWLPAGETAAEAAKNMRLVEETLELLRKKP